MSKTVAQLTTEINSTLPDNTTGQITPAVVRQNLLDIITSYLNLIDDPVLNSISNVDGSLIISPTTGSAVASARVATSSAPGIVQPDNSTITIAGGIISSVGSGGVGVIKEYASVTSLVASSPGNVAFVLVYGYASSGDAGEASTLFKQAARSAYNTVTSADGRFWAYVPNAAGFNPLWFGIKPDNSTDNTVRWADMLSALKLYGESSNFSNGTITSITFSLASGAGSALVVNWAGHGLRVNDGFIPSASAGVLPTGVNGDQVYFVLGGANFGANTFRFSTFNNYTSGNNSTIPSGPGSPVLATGSNVGSGSLTAYASGNEYIKVVIPPGSYAGAGSLSLFGGGGKNVDVDGYGAIFRATAISSGQGNLVTAPDNTFTSWAVLTAPARPGDTSVNIAPGDTGKLWVGQWVAIGGLDVQDANNAQTSWPPNLAFWEPFQIGAINTGTGVISIAGGLKLTQNYFTTWPTMNPGPATGFAIVGPAALYGFPFGWDATLNVSGIHMTDNNQGVLIGRNITLKDSIFDGGGITPTVSDSITVDNCEQLNVGIELDKMVNRMTFKNSNFYSIQSASQSSINTLIIDSCKLKYGLSGGGRRTIIRNNSFIPTMTSQFYGVCEKLLIDSSVIANFNIGNRLENVATPEAISKIVNQFVFSNGTLTIPIAKVQTSGCQLWAVPNHAMFVASYDNVDTANSFDNMGLPFRIRDVYKNGTDFCIDTTLSAAVSTLGSSKASTVTFAAGTDVGWAGHGLAANTPVTPLVLLKDTGVLDTALISGQIYYVLATGGPPANTFKISTSVGGSPITFNGNGSGTQTMIANPLMFRTHPCPSITVINASGCPQIVALNGAVDEPVFSRDREGYDGYYSGIAGVYRTLYAWGNLISLTVNVIRRDSSGFGAPMLDITANGKDNTTLAASNMSFSIDLTVAGVTTKTISDYTGWLCGPISVVPSGFSNLGNYNTKPIVTVEIRTDQGITKFPVWESVGAQQATGPISYYDTSGSGI